MFATRWVGRAQEPGMDLRVEAVSPSGEIREVARIGGLWDLGTVIGPGTVSVDGFLPVSYEVGDADGSTHDVLHLFDLHDPVSPHDPGLDPSVPLDRSVSTIDASWSPDGRLATDLLRDAGQGSWEATGVRLLLDPVTATQASVTLPADGQATTFREWLADGSGWMATRHAETRPDVPGVVSALDGTFTTLSPPLPQLFLGGGAEPQSVDGLGLRTSSSSPVGVFDPSDDRHGVWTTPAGQGDFGAGATTWWDRTGSRTRLLRVLWDIDGRGLLLFAERDDSIFLVRAESPGVHKLLARFWPGDLGPLFGARTSLIVDGLIAGPRPDELLVAFHTHGGNGEDGRLTLYSTFDRILGPDGGPGAPSGARDGSGSSFPHPGSLDWPRRHAVLA